MPTAQDIRRERICEHYSEVAAKGGACGCGTGRCCGGNPHASTSLGYAEADLARLPAGADMGLGCGTPLAFASLRQGEVVLDLGSGGGIDCFLAATQVGQQGRVIGVDMTPAMIVKARRNAARVSATNVEFRLGEIEALPVADRSVDVVVSNCVINLSPDKPTILREVFRVLRAGGRVAISDVIASASLPPELRDHPAALSGCIAGASAVEEWRAHLTDAGFIDVSVEIDDASRAFIKDWLPGSGAEQFVAAAAIRAVRPAGDACCGTAVLDRCC